MLLEYRQFSSEVKLKRAAENAKDHELSPTSSASFERLQNRGRKFHGAVEHSHALSIGALFVNRQSNRIRTRGMNPLAIKGSARPLWKTHLIVPTSRGRVEWKLIKP
jgi:hypothetical protein